MKKQSLILTFLFLVTSQTHAASFAAVESNLLDATNRMEKRPTFYIQCKLRHAADCENLRKDFFNRVTVIDRVDNDTAMIKVRLTEKSKSNGIIVSSSWSSNEEISMVDFSLPDLFLSKDYDETRMQGEILTLLMQGLIPHIRVKDGKGLDVITAKLEEPKNGEFDASVDLGGSVEKGGMGSLNPDGTKGPSSSNTSLNGSVTLNYSTQRARVLVNVNGEESKFSVPSDEGGKITAGNFAKTAKVLAVYSMTKDKRWSVAIMSSFKGDPGSNLRSGTSIGAGVEYNLVPFRIEKPYEFRVRTNVKQRSDRLVLVNERGNDHEQYSELCFELYTYWMLLQDKASFTGTLGASKNLTFRGYSSLDAGGTFSFQIFKGVHLNANASYSLAKRSINFPGEPDFSNPLQTQFQSGYEGGSFNTTVGLSFDIGRRRASSKKDRRFQ